MHYFFHFENRSRQIFDDTTTDSMRVVFPFFGVAKKFCSAGQMRRRAHHPALTWRSKTGSETERVGSEINGRRRR